MCRALRAARAEGWPGGIAVEHDGERTIVRFTTGAEPIGEGRGLDAIP